ncbi:MAG: hypothetical protein ISS76_21615 [Phycisphaerae bacterium]|nr:hypothetical protein [Phycisphaerae bacterium]
MNTKLTVLSLKLSIVKMESLMKVPVKERDVKWAHEVCTTSRMVHLNVWRFCPDREYVKDMVIPLLKKAQDSLLKLCMSKHLEEETKKKISDYAENDGFRAKNLEQNYLHCKPSAFRPGDKLSVWESQVG